MFEGRITHSCGTVNGSLVVVVGGYKSPVSSSSSEILDLTFMEWSQGPPFPQQHYSAGVVQYGDTFVIAGGGFVNDGVYKMDNVEMEWVLLGKLTVGKWDNMAIPLPNHLDLGCPVDCGPPPYTCEHAEGADVARDADAEDKSVR